MNFFSFFFLPKTLTVSYCLRHPVKKTELLKRAILSDLCFRCQQAKQYKNCKALNIHMDYITHSALVKCKSQHEVTMFERLYNM